jgi:hypothetical protein
MVVGFASFYLTFVFAFALGFVACGTVASRAIRSALRVHDWKRKLASRPHGLSSPFRLLPAEMLCEPHALPLKSVSAVPFRPVFCHRNLIVTVFRFGRIRVYSVLVETGLRPLTEFGACKIGGARPAQSS